MDSDCQALLDSVIGAVFADDAEFKHLASPRQPHGRAGQVDYRFAVGDQPHDADDVFRQLRWGGQFIFVSRKGRETRAAAAHFAERGFDVIRGPAFIRRGLPIPFFGRKTHYFVARKVLLVPPREISERFTYQVQLVDRGTALPGGVLPKQTPGGSPVPPRGTALPGGDSPKQTPGESPVPHAYNAGCTVLKEVPTTDRVAARLRKRFPEVSDEIITKRSRKFTEKIFPLFLTREAAMLQILERDLPAAYAGRVPKLLDMETDSRGYVRRLRMNWLRNGGKPLSQIEFARQCAELLHVLHDTVGVIHLDLRLDNIVITERGVGFVDFGSAVRVGENLAANPLLATLFDELMRTSEIQRMMSRMSLSGSLTSPIIQMGQQKVDKSVDFFYLALQINDPLKNPDFAGLIDFDPASREAAALKRMTDEVLRPTDINNPRLRSAGDMLRAIQLIADSHGELEELTPVG